MPLLIAPCVVRSLQPDDGTIGITAIDKRPVAGAVKVNSYGLYADATKIRLPNQT